MAKVLAEFATEDAIVSAIHALPPDHYRHLDGYMPYPSSAVEEALGRRSRLPLVVFVIGIYAAAAAYFLQWLLVAELYPLVVGNRPPHFPLAFVIITFEMGVLFAGLTSVIGVLVLGRLLRLADGVQGTPGFESATRDRFWLEVVPATIDLAALQRWLVEHGALRVVAVASLLVVASCGSCNLDLERMIDQPRFTAYEACDGCPDGTIMLQPPAHVVARDSELLPPELDRGTTTAGTAVTDLPLPVDRALLVRGRNRFDTFCAACHGRRGNGVSQVAENMQRRPPPDLLIAPYATRPPGHDYAVIRDGYGLMRSYAVELPVRDRWAVVAYLRVLRLSQAVALDELSPTHRAEARPWLR